MRDCVRACVRACVCVCVYVQMLFKSETVVIYSSSRNLEPLNTGKDRQQVTPPDLSLSLNLDLISYRLAL